MSETIDTCLKHFETIDFENIVDHPNILIAASFWDEDRYGASKTCYKLMRYIDDFIDNYKTDHLVIADEDRETFTRQVNEWLASIRDRHSDKQVDADLLYCFEHFKIPLWPMEAFAKAMIYDISHDGFASLQEFLDYAEGASVAPAAIFVHLAGLRSAPGGYLEPAFEVQKAARSCAVFSYLVHIIRDFWKDQHNHLNYFADDLLTKYGITRSNLHEMADGAPVHPGFRAMIREYVNIADEYRQRTFDSICEIRPLLEPRYRLSLDIIFNLYLMVFERIDPEHGSFSTTELNPTPAEIRERVHQTLINFKEN